ncbi:MAG TPA: metallopeptidase family protein [Candidatus Limnocylindrales bacterium]|jgi:predicted Zn-dependent protease with MMP-like domain|nr:metallopeptidase family protein [Candidatus Limnocylindrales bacterium]
MPLRRRGRQARRQPHRRVQLPPGPVHLPFEELVAQSLDELPAHIQQLLENVAVVIEDEPTPDQLRENDMAPDETLYGLYEGTPGIIYGADWAATPNKISLFRLPLEQDFPDPAELADEVRRTVVHELAHHAGLDDHRLADYGLD